MITRGNVFYKYLDRTFLFLDGHRKLLKKLLVRVYVPRLDKTCSPSELSIHFALFPWGYVLTHLQLVQSLSFMVSACVHPRCTKEYICYKVKVFGIQVFHYYIYIWYWYYLEFRLSTNPNDFRWCI